MINICPIAQEKMESKCSKSKYLDFCTETGSAFSYLLLVGFKTD